MNQQRPKSCPICRKSRVEEFHPFCSERCRDKDLARWFNDGYAVPGAPVIPDEMTEEGRD